MSTEIRSAEQFSVVWENLKWYHHLHKKSVWLVPTETGYGISVIQPKPEDLPHGTTAVLYGVNDEIEDEVDSNQHWITIPKSKPDVVFDGRTEEKYVEAWKKVKAYHGQTGMAVWLIPTETDYTISNKRPKAEDLPSGTAAIWYGTKEEVKDEVRSTKPVF